MHIVSTLLIAAALAAIFCLLFVAPRCPVCRGKHYREPGERHEIDCYLAGPRWK